MCERLPCSPVILIGVHPRYLIYNEKGWLLARKRKVIKQRKYNLKVWKLTPKVYSICKSSTAIAFISHPLVPIFSIAQCGYCKDPHMIVSSSTPGRRKEG